MGGRDITMDIHMNDSGFFDRLNTKGSAGMTPNKNQPNPNFANQYDKLFHTRDAGKIGVQGKENGSMKS